MITFTSEPKKVLSHQTESNKNGQFFSISFCNDHRSNFPYIKCLVIYIYFSGGTNGQMAILTQH